MTDDEALQSAIGKITAAYRSGLLDCMSTLREAVTDSIAASFDQYNEDARSFANGYLECLDNVEELLKVATR